MSKISVFVGGSIGSDPYSLRTWSGISFHLLKALQSLGMLDQAVGLKLPQLTSALLQAKNFNLDRQVWRKEYYLDTAYRRSLTRTAQSYRVSSEFCLQAGSMFSLPSVFPHSKCVSYHDGNLPQAIESGFGLEGVSRKRIDQALRYEEETSQQMAAVLTFSEYLRQSFIHDYHIPEDQVFNVGGAVNFTSIPPASPNKDYASNRILFIGIEFARKGGPQLLEAFRIVKSSFPSAELHIVGPSHLSEVPSGVIFHGRLSKADPAQAKKLEALFRSATLFILPSLYEPFGIAPLEAMFYEVPCVVTDAWALREFVTPGVNGDLVAKGSVDDLASKICGMLADPARLATMGQKARELVLGKYTWDQVVGRMDSILQMI